VDVKYASPAIGSLLLAAPALLTMFARARREHRAAAELRLSNMALQRRVEALEAQLATMQCGAEEQRRRDVAVGRGIEKIVAEMMPEQKGAITVMQKLGFRVEGLFRDHVRDRRGEKHDLVVMAHEVHDAGEQLDHLGITEAVGAAP